MSLILKEVIVDILLYHVLRQNHLLPEPFGWLQDGQVRRVVERLDQVCVDVFLQLADVAVVKFFDEQFAQYFVKLFDVRVDELAWLRTEAALGCDFF